METLGITLLLLATLVGFVLLMASSWGSKTEGRYEAKVQKVDHTYVPPASDPEPPSWLSFRLADGTVHIRVSRIQSFSYSFRCRSLTINDGTENPVTIPDPSCRHYARLCQRFGVLPMSRILKGADKG